MPAAGGVDITKKLRMMEFWGNQMQSISLTAAHAAGVTTLTEVYKTIGSGYTTNGVDWTTGGEEGAINVSTSGGGGSPYTQTIEHSYADGVTIHADRYNEFIVSKKIIVSDLPPGAIIQRVSAIIYFNEIENTTGVLSSLDTPSNFSFNGTPNRFRVDCRKVGSLRNMDCGSLPNDTLTVPSNGYSAGTTIILSDNIKNVVTANDDYYIQWKAAFLAGSIKLHSPRFGLRIYFK